MINRLKFVAALLSIPSLLMWLWRGRRRDDPPAGDTAAPHPAVDEARYFEAEWREAEQMASAAMQDLDEALATIAQLHVQLEQQWEFTRELLLLNASGYYSNVRFDYDDEGAVQGVYLSQKDRVRFAPAGDLDNLVPPAQWNRN